MAAVLTTFVTGDPIVDGLLSGSKWASPNVTFSFPTSASQYPTGETEAATFQPLTALMHAAAYKVLGNFSAVSGLVFTEDAASPGTATIRMGFSEAAAPTSYAYYPSDDALGVGGDVWFSRAQAFTPNAFDSPITSPICTGETTCGGPTTLPDETRTSRTRKVNELGGTDQTSVNAIRPALL